MKIDVSKLTEKELIKLQDDVKKALADVSKRKLAEARKAAEAAAQKHGFSLSEIVGPGKKPGKKSASAPKYANPADPSQTWSGRGRQPAWYKDAVAGGADPASMAI